MTLKSKIVTMWGMVYLSMPTIVFLISWLRWEIAIPATVLVVMALIMVLRSCSVGQMLAPMVESSAGLEIAPSTLIVLSGSLLCWCILAGQGGFVVQTHDWHWRNAIFRDLITHDWPVRYDAWNRALVFYVGHWLPPALVGKLAMAITGEPQWSWRIGNVALLLWTYVGVMLVLAQILLLVNASSSRLQLGALLLLVFFGGCGALGTIILSCGKLIFGWQYGFAWWEFHPWWSEWYQFSSNSTCLYWVFHQTIVPWVAMLLLARGLRLADVAFVLSLVLICAPLPGIGIAFFIIVLVVQFLLVRAKYGGWRDACSPQNLIGVVVVVPFVALYLLANPASGGWSFVWSEMAWSLFVSRTMLFLSCEIGLYFLLTYKWFKMNIWWHCALVWLCFCPLVRIGGGQPDFCMRASIPAMIILALMCFCSYIKDKSLKLHNCHSVLLLLCMVVGALVPWREMTFYFGRFCNMRYDNFEADDIVTFDQDLIGKYGTFRGERVVANCNAKEFEEMLFYKFIARRRRSSTMEVRQ